MRMFELWASGTHWYPPHVDAHKKSRVRMDFRHPEDSGMKEEGNVS
jgi:hypothetical protein